MRDRLVLDGYMTELLNDRRYQDERQAILPQFPTSKEGRTGRFVSGSWPQRTVPNEEDRPNTGTGGCQLGREWVQPGGEATQYTSAPYVIH